MSACASPFGDTSHIIRFSKGKRFGQDQTVNDESGSSHQAMSKGVRDDFECERENMSVVLRSGCITVTTTLLLRREY